MTDFFKKEIEELSNKFIKDLKYVIETNIINQDFNDEEEEEEEENNFDPLEYKFLSLKVSKEKFIELLQKVTKSCVALTKSIKNNERSNMIYAARDITTFFTQINEEAIQISKTLPEGKSKEKLLESTSKCKSMSVQLKINISVKASSEAGDDLTDLHKKTIDLIGTIEQCFQTICHSDRVFNDMDFNKQSSFGGGNTGSWNNVAWN